MQHDEAVWIYGFVFVMGTVIGAGLTLLYKIAGAS